MQEGNKKARNGTRESSLPRNDSNHISSAGKRLTPLVTESSDPAFQNKGFNGLNIECTSNEVFELRSNVSKEILLQHPKTANY